jgi:hypothetical protein
MDSNGNSISINFSRQKKRNYGLKYDSTMKKRNNLFAFAFATFYYSPPGPKGTFHPSTPQKNCNIDFIVTMLLILELSNSNC